MLRRGEEDLWVGGVVVVWLCSQARRAGDPLPGMVWAAPSDPLSIPFHLLGGQLQKGEPPPLDGLGRRKLDKQ